MADKLNFRSALSGFHREDVVHYIEYINSKHTTQVNQLNDEIDRLRAQVKTLTEQPDLSQEVARLNALLEESAKRQQQLEQERDQAQAELEEQKAQQAQITAQQLASMELDAYRRAEQAERAAKARAQQLYQQATGALAQATTQVDEAALRYRQIAEQVSGQLTQLQLAVESSKSALLDAATTMYAVHPEDEEV